MIGRTFALLFPAAAALAMAAPAAAETRVLDFTQGNYCRGGQLCTNNGTIDQSYGDTANLDVNYFSLVGATRTQAFYYERGFGDLEGVLYAGNGSATSQGQIVFTASTGFELSLLSFDAGCFAGNANCRNFDWSVFDGSGQIAAGSGSTGYPTHTAVNLGTGYSQQLVLNFGTGDNVGLDNIRFDIRPSAAVPSVPEPASWAMMIAGVGGIGGALRRRKGAGGAARALA